MYLVIISNTTAQIKNNINMSKEFLEEKNGVIV